MPKMTFRGAKVIDFKGVKPEGSDQVFEVSMAADFSEPVRKHFGWDIAEQLEDIFPKLRDKDPVSFDRATMLFPAGVRTMGLEGSVNAKSIELTPNGKELAANKMSLACTEIGWFSLHRVKQPNGSFVHELRFTAIVHEIGAGAALEAYQQAMGKHTASMRVGYERQESLPLAEGDDAADDQETLISPEQAADTAEAADDDTPRTTPPKSHQRKRADAPGARRGAEQIPDPVEAVQ
jgi:hypothetical protein